MVTEGDESVTVFVPPLVVFDSISRMDVGCDELEAVDARELGMFALLSIGCGSVA